MPRRAVRLPLRASMIRLPEVHRSGSPCESSPFTNSHFAPPTFRRPSNCEFLLFFGAINTAQNRSNTSGCHRPRECSWFPHVSVMRRRRRWRSSALRKGSTSGATHGVSGTASSPSGTGTSGTNLSSGGYGVYGQPAGTALNTAGVYGTATSSSGTEPTYGVYGTSATIDIASDTGVAGTGSVLSSTGSSNGGQPEFGETQLLTESASAARPMTALPSMPPTTPAAILRRRLWSPSTIPRIRQRLSF